ncbi:uncharacterized protein LOC6538249 [Drosophila yakuba]|uniref:Uncharacterized protein n=1 Tax=Drosophila yakuba TaxID=7245 RepID=B4PRC4_DROYA|nr:uncharacterized protein LOC6538249 [Drosophila yakuba]EDW98488.1 uncharacterized protein Dyak_GE10553 [Drosophila yakuba]
MCANLLWLSLIAFGVLAKSGDSFATKRYFGVGERVNGDQLLVKDVLHSRPASGGELPGMTFTYEVLEPITCVEILSDENISAEVKFSLVNRLIVGIIQLAATNQSVDPATPEEATIPPTTEFDVTIMVFGLNDTSTHFDPALVINRDQQFQGEMEPYEEIFPEPDQFVEVFDNNRRDALEIDEDYDNLSEEDIESFTEGPFVTDYFDRPDKYIEVGKRQAGDELLYNCYQTSPDDSETPSNHSVVFYYIDNNSITYVRFSILDHYANRNISDADYKAPQAEYSHYTSGTLKAVITDFDSKSLFVQMYVYGYRGRTAPESYEPFLPPPLWQKAILESRTKSNATPHLTPLQTLQLLLLTGQRTTPPPEAFNGSVEAKEEQRSIRPEEMMFERIKDESESESEKNSALRQMNQSMGMGALLGLLFLILHN